MREPERIAHPQAAPRPVRHWRGRVFQLYLLVSILAFSALAFLASSRPYFALDVTVTLWIQRVQSGAFDGLMRLVSWFGFAPQVAFIVPVLSGLLWGMKLKREAGVSAAAGVGSLLLNTLIKTSIARPRPTADLVHVFQQLNSYSFPSGHVMFYTAYFGFLWFLAFVLLQHSWRRLALLGVFGALVALVGPSRIYLGQHWFSDVLAAYLLGSLILAGAVSFYRLRERK